MQRFITFAFLVFTVYIYSQSQDIKENSSVQASLTNPSYPSLTSGSWVGLPASPNPFSRSCCVLVRISGMDYLYQFGGGNSNSDMRKVARLNLSNNTWQSNITTIPYTVSSGTAIAMRGDSVIYVFGGYLGNLGRTMSYNVYTNAWSTLATMPIKVTDALVVKYSESLIYVVGGGDGYFGTSAFRTNKVQLFNANNGTYTVVNDYPINCSMLGGGIYRDTIIAVGGYTNGGNATANCYKGVINPSTHNISWSSMPSYPEGAILRFASYTAVKDNGVGVMCTGGSVDGTNPTAKTHFWNFCTQSWQNGLPDNSLARSNFKATGRGNVIYVVGGFTNNGVGTCEKLIFNYIDGPCYNMLGINNNNSMPEQFSLSQNYPNPFNPSTKIKFEVPSGDPGRGAFVFLGIYDMLGRQLQVLVNENLKQGVYEVEWDASGYPSGTYFYKLEGGTYTSTKKMMLIK